MPLDRILLTGIYEIHQCWIAKNEWNLLTAIFPLRSIIIEVTR